MIAKGNLHAHGGKLAAYLTTTGKGDLGAELVELRGFVADNIRDAFTDVQIQSEATRCQKPFFHAYMRLPAEESLTREQWLTVAGRVEKRLGFEDQPRAVAFHYKPDGSTHMHVAWSRIDLDTMKAIDPGLYKNKLKELCREMERDFGLTLVRNERDPEQQTRAAGRNEFEQSRRLNTDLKAIRETIRDCWDRSDNGRAFNAALEQQGLILARGDRRDFVVVDAEGGDHALGKRITGATAAETRARLADMDRTHLPSVDRAKEIQLERAHKLERREPEASPNLAAEPRTPIREKAGPEIHTPRLRQSRAAERDMGDRIIRSGKAVAGRLMVAADAVGKPAEKLTDFVGGLLKILIGGSTRPRKISADEYLDNPEARAEAHAQRRAERASEEALERIRRDIQADRNLRPEDVRMLNPAHVQNIMAKGDAYLLEMIGNVEREQAKSSGRERER